MRVSCKNLPPDGHVDVFSCLGLRAVHFDYLYKGVRDSVPIADDNSDSDELVKAVLLSGVHTVLQPRGFDVVKGRTKKANVHITR